MGHPVWMTTFFVWICNFLYFFRHLYILFSEIFTPSLSTFVTTVAWFHFNLFLTAEHLYYRPLLVHRPNQEHWWYAGLVDLLYMYHVHIYVLFSISPCPSYWTTSNALPAKTFASCTPCWSTSRRTLGPGLRATRSTRTSTISPSGRPTGSWPPGPPWSTLTTATGAWWSSRGHTKESCTSTTTLTGRVASIWCTTASGGLIVTLGKQPWGGNSDRKKKDSKRIAVEVRFLCVLFVSTLKALSISRRSLLSTNRLKSILLGLSFEESLLPKQGSQKDSSGWQSNGKRTTEGCQKDKSSHLFSCLHFANRFAIRLIYPSVILLRSQPFAIRSEF